MNANFFNSSIPFIVLFVVFAAFYYDGLLDKGPMNMHIWRQTDCLSMAHHYAEGSNFLEPEMHSQFADDHQSGKSAGEFPVLYYIVGKIWNVTGETYFSYRVFYLLLLFGGLLAFYKTLKLVLKDNFWATFGALLLFTSPVFVLYGVSFLTDAPAFSFILVAIYFLTKYHLEKKYKWFYLAMLFFALGGLIKVSSLIVFVFLIIVLALETFGLKTLKEKTLFHGKVKEWAGMATALLAIVIWYYYARNYNAEHGFKYTFNSIFPMWRMSSNELNQLWIDIVNLASNVFYSRPMIFLFAGGFLVNLLLWKKIPPLVYAGNIIISVGAVLYMLLWAPLIGVHDYYYMPLLILVIGILGPLTWHLKVNHSKIFERPILKGILALFLLFNFAYCYNVVQLRTVSKEGNTKLVFNEDFVKQMHWMNSVDRIYWKRFEKMQPYLRNLGVKKEDKVISLPDISFNSSLYMMGQKGWSNFPHYSTEEEIQELVESGAKYLIVAKPEVLEQEFLQPFLANPIGDFEGCLIYKL